MSSKAAPITAIVSSAMSKSKSRPSSMADAANEIAGAFNIPNDAAMMTLYGLCATGNVRWVGKDRKVIDADECTVADFWDKPRFVAADDVQSFLRDWSSSPQPKQRDAVIDKKLRSGAVPGRNISWKEFCDGVRNECNGWRAKGKPAWGFGDKEIQRIYKELRSK